MRENIDKNLREKEPKNKNNKNSINSEQIISHDDKEMQNSSERLNINVKIVGCGGSGSNTITRLSEIGIYGAELIAAGTDSPHLGLVKANRKILLGNGQLGTFGPCLDPRRGEVGAMLSDKELRDILQGSDVVFITAGLGGGTGSGSAPYVAKVAKELNPKTLVIGIVTLPFYLEGKVRMENAINSINQLMNYCNTAVVISFDKILKIVPKIQFVQAYDLMNDVLAVVLKGLAEIITKPSLVEKDYQDFKTIFANGSLATIGIGESDISENRVQEAVDDAIKSLMIDVDINQAKDVMILIEGGPSMIVSEVRKAAESIKNQLNPNAKVIWYDRTDLEMENETRAIIVLMRIENSDMFDVKVLSRRLEKN